MIGSLGIGRLGHWLQRRKAAEDEAPLPDIPAGPGPLLLVRVAPDGTRQLDRWDLGMRVRDVAVDGAGHVWIISDAEEGALYRLVPN